LKFTPVRTTHKVKNYFFWTMVSPYENQYLNFLMLLYYGTTKVA
jgi:hypothetical protein